MVLTSYMSANIYKCINIYINVVLIYINACFYHSLFYSCGEYFEYVPVQLDSLARFDPHQIGHGLI